MPSPRAPRPSSQERRDKYEHKTKHKSKLRDDREYSRSRYMSDDDYKRRNSDKYKEFKKTQQYEDFEETKNNDFKDSKSAHRYEDYENTKVDLGKGSKKTNKREHSEETKTDKYKEFKKARKYEDYENMKSDKYQASKKRRHYEEDSEEIESRYSRPSSKPKPRRESTDSYTKYSRQERKKSSDRDDDRDDEKQSKQATFDDPKEDICSEQETGNEEHNEEHADSDRDSSPTPDPTPREYRRYWGRGDSGVRKTSGPSIDKSESSSRHKNNDRYWSKYPVNDEEHSVGPRYYEKRSSKSRPKEPLKRKREDEHDGEMSRPRNTRHNYDRKRSVGSEIQLDEPNPSVTSTSNMLTEGRTNAGENPSLAPLRQKKNLDMLTTKTGGAYIPPARLRMMQAQITDKSSAAYQRLSWEALKKSIHGHINKVNVGNIGVIVRELLKENIVRGRGLLCRSIIQAQAASPTFTHVYAALVAVINSKFPNIGELLLRRLIIQFKRGFKRNDKSICISAASFIAHLVNQKVAHEILALEILTLLVENPTDDSVEVAIAFLKECGMKLVEVSNKGVHAIFEMLRNILHEGHLDIRVQYMIEVMFQVRKDNFRDHVAVLDDLDLVDEEDQFTHLIMLEDVKDGEDILNVFKLDPEYEENEAKYKALKKEILDEGSSDSGGESGSEEESEEESENEEEAKESTIIDNTETNLIALRRTIYLTIHSSLDFEECAHKLMRMELKPGQEIELCHMFLDCCAEQRTYEKFYGLLAQRFCQINKIFIPPFQQIFQNTYNTIHRLDTNKLRNVAKFFAHLLFTDAISWEVLSLIHLNEEETTSSSRIFIKILFQELSEYMGLTKLNERVKDSTLQEAFEGLFPRDNPKNTRFAINFFTSIGLGGLTDELREHLKSQPRVSVAPKIAEPVQVSSDSSSSDSSSSSSSSDSSSSDSSSSSSSSESENSDDRSKSKKAKAGKEKQRRKKKGNSKSVQRKKAIDRSPPKHKKKKSSR